MKLNNISVAVSLLVAMTNVYASNLGSTTPTSSGLCKVVGGKVTSFTPHQLAGKMAYTSSEPTIVSVNEATGQLQGKKRGTVFIIVTQAASNKAKGDTKSCALTVIGKKPNLMWTPGITAPVDFEPGKTVSLKTPTTVNNESNIVYTSNNPNVADISSDGKKITIKGEYADRVTFTATQKETELFEPAQATFTLQIGLAKGGMGFEAGAGKFELQ